MVAYIASKLGDGRLLGLADQALANAIGEHLPWAALVAFSWLTHLGDAELLAPVCVVVALLLWRRAHHGLALGWVMACFIRLAYRHCAILETTKPNPKRAHFSHRSIFKG